MKLPHSCVALATVFAFSVLSCLPGLAGQTNVAATARPAEVGLDKAIHDYILAHPEVLIQSLRLAKQRQAEQRDTQVKSLITSMKKDLVNDPAAPILGNPAGDATIVEFFDYRCPYCRQVERSLHALINIDPKVRIVEKELPILGPASVYAARVALAAYKQNKHNGLRAALMAKKANFHEADILKVAGEVGLDIDLLKADMNGPDGEAEIRRNFEIAKALNLNGTPAFIVGTQLIPGATDLETLESLVDDARHGLN